MFQQDSLGRCRTHSFLDMVLEEGSPMFLYILDQEKRAIWFPTWNFSCDKINEL